MRVSKVDCTAEVLLEAAPPSSLTETPLIPSDVSTVKLKFRVRRMSVLQAADRLHGIIPEVAQVRVKQLAFF
jgi:hypothetical protein